MYQDLPVYQGLQFGSKEVVVWPVLKLKIEYCLKEAPQPHCPFKRQCFVGVGGLDLDSLFQFLALG